MISYYTPFHKKDTSFLKQAYKSLLEQTHPNYEWVIVCNGEGLEADLSFLKDDKRVIIKKVDFTGNIGKLKGYAVDNCNYDLVAELDYDDVLTDNCTEEVLKAFKEEDTQFVYSNCCEFVDLSWHLSIIDPNIRYSDLSFETIQHENRTYSSDYGWRSRSFIYKEKEYIETISFPISSQMIRRVEWAPNHIRSFRKKAYFEIGGYNESLPVGDDHELCCRFYITYGDRGFKLIDKPLYFYRVHHNTVQTYNAQIQNQTDQNYLKYSRQLAYRWAKDNNLKCIDLGGRFGCPEGYLSVDRLDADIKCDLNKKKWPFKESSVGVVRASHIFEHLKDPINTMNECYRILAPGGWLFIDVPSTDGKGAWCDPTHISFWNESSFRYYTNKQFAAYIKPEYKGRFQLSRKVTWVPPEFKEDNIPVVQADLICLKPPYDQRAPGQVLI